MRVFALFVVLLVVLVTVAVAQDLSIAKYSGADGVNGFAKSHDELTVEVLASLFGNPVQPSNVRLYHGGNFLLFDECVLESGAYYRCIYSDPFNWVGSFPFTVKLLDNSVPPAVVADASGIVVVDDFSPVVNLSCNVKRTKGPARLTYVVRDFGLSSSVAGNCSGIRRISFERDGVEFASEFGAVGSCLKQGYVEHDFGAAGVEDEFSVCAVAEDYLGHESVPVCVDLFVDAVGPDISDFGIFNGTGDKITHLRPGAGIDARVIVTVEDFSGVKSVKGSFGALTSDPAYFGFVAASSSYGNRTFVWDDVPVSEVSTCEAVIRAEDILGNVVERAFSCDIKADSTAPEFVDAYTGKTKNGTVLLGYDTVLFVKFSDADDAGAQGTGLALGQAYLDLRQLGLGANVMADNCVFDSPYWICSWNLKPAVASGRYTLQLSARDDLSNQMASAVPIVVEYDNEPPVSPVVREFSVVALDPARTLPAHYDTVVFKVRSGGFSSAFANFSGIGGGDSVAALGCAPVPGLNLADCTFESVVGVSGPLNAHVAFTFFDEAGNRASVPYSFAVYELMDDPNPNYWSHVVKCSPDFEGNRSIARVDRMIAAQVGGLFSCNVELTAYDIDTEIASISGPNSITDCTVSNPTYLGSISYLNAKPDGARPYLLVSTKARDVTIDEINVSCPLYVTSKKGGKVVRTAERENVKFRVRFYNEPLGDAYRNMEKRIDDQFDAIDDFEWIGELRKWVHYAEVGCNLKNIFANALGVAQGIVNIVGAGDTVLCKTLPFLCPTGTTPTYQEICGSAEDMEEAYETDVATFFDGLCGIVNCQMATGKTWTSGIDWAGGGVPWCTGWDALWKDWMGLEDTRTGKSPDEMGYGGTTLNVLPIQDSLIGSSVCLCLPGIIRNLEKLRQIECNKAVCLANDYAVQGFGVSVCDATYDYMLCNFIVGDIFSIFPISNLIDQFADLITEWFADPFSALITFLGAGCRMSCYLPDASLHTACSVVRVASLIGESVGSIVAIVEADDYFGKPVDDVYCAQAEKLKEEWDKKEGQG